MPAIIFITLGQGSGHYCTPNATYDRYAGIQPSKCSTRDYLRVRLASLLPGVVSNDMLEGFSGDDARRPWVVQSLVSGMVPKTHSFHVDYEVWKRTPESTSEFEHFFALLRFCRDEAVLLRDAPVSIEAAVVGFLRPSTDRCLLALVQFAGRPASVQVRLRQPDDLPAGTRAAIDLDFAASWTLRERLRSTADPEAHPEKRIMPGEPITCELGPYGYRLFEMTLNRG